jgi:hypothetical protein
MMSNQTRDDILENEHNDFVNSDNFQKMIDEKIKYSYYHKYDGIAPEGFCLISENVLDQLKDFDIWKQWKNNPELIKKLTIQELKNVDFVG